jgi:hypothetical protein
VAALAEIVDFPHHGTSENAWKALNVGYRKGLIFN